MCNLGEAIEERGIRKGIERGIVVLIETCREFGVSKEATAEKVQQKFDLTSEKIDDVMTRYWT